MARWFVIRGGSEHGPLSDAELKSAAAAGKIRPDDTVRREDGKVSRLARELKGLTFPPDLNSRLLTADDDFDSIDPFNLKAASPETGIAACLAQKEKIRNTLLPRAYVALGRKYFEGVDHSPTGQPPPPEVAPFVEQIDALLLNAPTPSGPGTQSTTDPARERAVEHQLAKKYAQLGKRAYEVGKLPPSFLAEHNAIQDLLQRDKLLTHQVDVLRVEAKRKREADELAAQLRRAKQTAVAVADTMKGAGESLMYSTPILVILATLVPPVGLWLIWQHPTWGIKSKIRWTGLSVAVFLSLIMANQVRTAFLTATEASLNAKNWAIEQLAIATGTAPSAVTPAPQAAPQPQPPAVGQNGPAANGRRSVDNGEEMEMATWSPDGTKIATASKEKIRIWDSKTLKLQQEITRAPSEGFPECLFTADDGSRLVTPSDNGVLQLWDVPAQRIIETTQLSKPILGMSRSTQGNTVLVRHPQNWFEVRQTSNLQKVYASFQIPPQLKWWTPIGSFDGQNLHAVISEKSEVIIVNAKQMRIVKRLPPPGSLKAHSLGLAVSRDGRRLAVGSDRGGVYVYDTTSWNQVCYCDLKTAAAYSVAFSSDGKLIVSGNVDGALRVWDADSGKLLKTHRPGTGQISSVSFSPDGREVSFTEIRGGQKLFVWDASTLLD